MAWPGKGGCYMTEAKAIRRKISLKIQALKLIRTERDGLRHELNLLHLRDFLQSQTSKVFDPKLSAQLDAVQLLLDSFGVHFQTSGVFDGQN